MLGKGSVEIQVDAYHQEVAGLSSTVRLIICSPSFLGGYGDYR